jgi:hypothetical protein
MDVSEEHIVIIFRVEEWAKGETSMKQVASRVNGLYMNQEGNAKREVQFPVGFPVRQTDTLFPIGSPT